MEPECRSGYNGQGGIVLKIQKFVIGFQNEKTPLHVAAEQGHTQVVETLIDKFGFSLNFIEEVINKRHKWKYQVVNPREND